VIRFRHPPGAYQIVTGSGTTSDEAAAGVFHPDASIVLLDTEHHPPYSVVYTFLVDYDDD